MEEQTKKHGPWVQTASGRAFDLLEPRVEDVLIEDIAHALSRLARFSGHTRGDPYTVAHHSILVADILTMWGAPPEVVREGLLHDAGEAYYGDLTLPLKLAIRGLTSAACGSLFPSTTMLDEAARDALWDLDVVAAVTKPIDRVVRQALDLPEHQTPLVKRADLVALAIERRDLMAPCERDWQLTEYADTRHRLHDPSYWSDARNTFLARLEKLNKGLP